jgi:hypothetical protein
MTLQLVHSEIPIYEKNFSFLFYQRTHISSVVCTLSTRRVKHSPCLAFYRYFSLT